MPIAAIRRRIHLSMINRRELIALAPALILPACSSAPEKKAPEKAPEPVTGLHALYQMYTSARTWAQDLQILHYSSINIREVKSQPGKAAAWQVVFVSQALMQSRTISFSVYEASVTLHQGIFPDSPQPWSGGGKPFLLRSGEVRHRCRVGNRAETWRRLQQQESEYADRLYAGDRKRE